MATHGYRRISLPRGCVEELRSGCTPNEELRLGWLLVPLLRFLSLCLPLPAPPLGKEAHDAGRVLLERRAAHHALPGCQVLCGVTNNPFEIPVGFPLRLLIGPSLRVPGGLEDFEDKVLSDTPRP